MQYKVDLNKRLQRSNAEDKQRKQANPLWYWSSFIIVQCKITVDMMLEIALNVSFCVNTKTL